MEQSELIVNRSKSSKFRFSKLLLILLFIGIFILVVEGVYYLYLQKSKSDLKKVQNVTENQKSSNGEDVSNVSKYGGTVLTQEEVENNEDLFNGITAGSIYLRSVVQKSDQSESCGSAEKIFQENYNGIDVFGTVTNVENDFANLTIKTEDDYYWQIKLVSENISIGALTEKCSDLFTLCRSTDSLRKAETDEITAGDKIRAYVTEINGNILLTDSVIIQNF